MLRNNRTLHQTEVVDIVDITPRMRRISIVGESLPLLGINLPGQWMKVFVPTADNEVRAGRAYTIRSSTAPPGGSPSMSCCTVTTGRRPAGRAAQDVAIASMSVARARAT